MSSFFFLIDIVHSLIIFVLLTYFSRINRGLLVLLHFFLLVLWPPLCTVTQSISSLYGLYCPMYYGSSRINTLWLCALCSRVIYVPLPLLHAIRPHVCKVIAVVIVLIWNAYILMFTIIDTITIV